MGGQDGGAGARVGGAGADALKLNPTTDSEWTKAWQAGMGLRVTLSILLPRLVLAGLHRAVEHQVGRLVLLLGRLEVLHHVQGRVARRELLRALLLLVLPDLLLRLVLARRDAVELVAELPERLPH